MRGKAVCVCDFELHSEMCRAHVRFWVTERIMLEAIASLLAMRMLLPVRQEKWEAFE